MQIEPRHKPWRHGNDLVGFEFEVPLLARWIALEDLVHEEEELLYPLVLPQVLTTLYQVVVLLLIIPTNCYPLRFTNWGHDFNLENSVHVCLFRIVKVTYCQCKHMKVFMLHLPALLTLWSKPTTLMWYSGIGLFIPSYWPKLQTKLSSTIIHKHVNGLKIMY